MAIDGSAERPSARSGLLLVLAATVIAGAVSYVLTWLVPSRVGFASYAVFAVFWSFLYLLVGALGGVQQEVTRGTQLVDPAAPPRVNRARNFGIALGTAVFALIVATAPIWVDSVFPAAGWGLVWPLAVGAASYVLIAVLAGSLYGVSEWTPLTLMIVVDAILRLAAVAVVLLFTTDIVALAWAVALPFPLALLLLWPFIRERIVGRTQVDVGYRVLTRNVGQTVVAAASTGVMVSGFPLLLGVVSRGEPDDLVGLFILSITLARAPLIVVALSLQSYFVVTFRDKTEEFGKRFAGIVAVVAGAGMVLATAAWSLGPPVFAILFPGERVPEGWFLAVLVFSSALVGALCVTAAAVLARSLHLAYGAGWLVAAIVTVLLVALPIDFTLRTVIALVGGPVAGLIVHGVALAVEGRATR